MLFVASHKWWENLAVAKDVLHANNTVMLELNFIP